MNKDVISITHVILFYRKRPLIPLLTLILAFLISSGWNNYLHHDDYYLQVFDNNLRCSAHPQYVYYMEYIGRPLGIHFKCLIGVFIHKVFHSAIPIRLFLASLLSAITSIFYYLSTDFLKKDDKYDYTKELLISLFSVSFFALSSSITFLAHSTILIITFFATIYTFFFCKLYQTNYVNQKSKFFKITAIISIYSAIALTTYQPAIVYLLIPHFFIILNSLFKEGNFSKIIENKITFFQSITQLIFGFSIAMIPYLIYLKIGGIKDSSPIPFGTIINRYIQIIKLSPYAISFEPILGILIASVIICSLLISFKGKMISLKSIISSKNSTKLFIFILILSAYFFAGAFPTAVVNYPINIRTFFYLFPLLLIIFTLTIDKNKKTFINLSLITLLSINSILSYLPSREISSHSNFIESQLISQIDNLSSALDKDDKAISNTLFFDLKDYNSKYCFQEKNKTNGDYLPPLPHSQDTQFSLIWFLNKIHLGDLAKKYQIITITKNNKCWGGDCSKYSEDIEELRTKSISRIYMTCPMR